MSKSAYVDLGIPESEAGERALRVALAVQIRNYIDDNRLRQADASALFGVPQPTISKITRLDLSKLSLSLLLRMLFRAGLPFRLSSQGNTATVSAVVSASRQAVLVKQDWTLPRPPDVASAKYRVVRTTGASSVYLPAGLIN